VCYRVLSLHYVCIRSLGIILAPGNFVPNFVSFAASVAELAHKEKLCTHSFTHPAYMRPREPNPVIWNNVKKNKKHQDQESPIICLISKCINHCRHNSSLLMSCTENPKWLPVGHFEYDQFQNLTGSFHNSSL